MKAIDILSFHPGRQHNFEQAFQIQNSFENFRHVTSLYFGKERIRQCKSISSSLSAGLKRRSAEIAPQYVDTNPLPELKLLLKRKLGYSLSYPDYLERNLQFQNWMLKKYDPPKICIGFDTSSWAVFDRWKNRSFLILDLSIAVPQYKLTLAKESNCCAEFISHQTNSDKDVYYVYEKELQLADMVLCGSEFVKRSCLSIGIDNSKLKVLPYGADLSKFNGGKTEKIEDEKIKVVFVGSVGYRKGADVLLKVWDRISKIYKNAELHFYGNVQMDLPNDIENIYYHGFISQDKLIAELSTAHISVLPTFFEGSSLAIYQSMAMGLAVITTENAGSIIEHNYSGIIVPYGNVDALYQSLSKLLKQPFFRQQIADHAKEKIKQFTWKEYGDKLATLLQLGTTSIKFPVSNV